MELKEYWNILRRRRWVVVQAFVVVLLTALVVTRFVTPIYQASAKLLVQPKPLEAKLTLPEAFEGMGKPEEDVTTHVTLLLTLPMMERVVRRLNLRDADGQPLPPQSLLPPKGFGLKSLMPLPARRLQAERVGEASIIRITALSPHRQEATKLADTLAQVYMEESQRRSRASARSAREYVQRQLTVTLQEWRKARWDLNQFKKRNNTINLEEESKVGIQKMADLLSSREDTVQELREAEDRLKAVSGKLRTLAPREVTTITQVNNPQVQELKSNLAKLYTDLYGLLTRYTENHDQVRALRKQISEVKAQLSQEVNRILGSQTTNVNPLYQDLLKQATDNEVKRIVNKGKRQVLDKLIAKYTAVLKTLPDKERQLAELTLKAKTSEDAVRLLQESWHRLRIQEAMQISNIQLVEPAIAPLKPVRPNIVMNAIMGAFMGLLLGLFLAFLVEYLDDTVKSPSTAQEWAKLPVLAVVPRFPKRHGALVQGFGTRSPVAEAYRTLRYNIKLASPDRPVKCILITSALPQEGKTVTCANLALTYANAGQSVLLLDADMRRPQLQALLRLSNHSGLTNVLSGDGRLEEVVGRVRTLGDGSLQVLPSGELPPDPSRLLESQRMKSLLKEVKDLYDVVIIDTPPLLLVNDANLLSQAVDGIILVARAGISTRSSLQLATETLNRAHAPVLGVVLNAYSPIGRDGYYGYYHYYGYGYDERKAETERKQEQPTGNTEREG